MLPYKKSRRIAYQVSTDYDAMAAAKALGAMGYDVRPFRSLGVEERDYQPAASRPVFGGGVQGYSMIFRGRRWSPDTYPACVREFLRRDVTESTLGAALRSRSPIFLKPRTGGKPFSGFVFDRERNREALWMTETHGSAFPVWTAAPVRMVNEWRVLSLRGKIVAASPNPYKQTSWAPPDRRVAQAIARRLWEAMPEYPATSFDVAIVGRETALVEVNGTLALGRYGMAIEPYARCIVTTWRSVCEGPAVPPLTWIEDGDDGPYEVSV